MSLRRWSKHAFTSSDSQLINGSWITSICSARKQWDGLSHSSVSCKWGKLLQSEKSNFQPSKMRLPYTITPLQKRRPLEAAGGAAWLAGPGSPPMLSCLGEKKQITCALNRHYPLLEKPTSTPLISASTGSTCRVPISSFRSWIFIS